MFLHLIARVVSCVVLEWVNHSKWEKKSRNSLQAGYTISGVELNNNVISINKPCNFALFFTLTLFLSIHKKQNLTNIWDGEGGGGAAALSAPSGFYGPALCWNQLHVINSIIGVVRTIYKHPIWRASQN